MTRHWCGGKAFAFLVAALACEAASAGELIHAWSDFGPGPIADAESSMIRLVGDFDGDGVPDVAVGTSADGSGSSGGGAVRVYRVGQWAAPIFQVLGQTSESLGRQLETADLDGDGLGEVIASAPMDGRVLPEGGSVRAWKGPSASLAWQAMGMTSRGRFGQSLAVIGDVNADGFLDVAGGAPWFSNSLPAFRAGEVLVLSGSDGSLIHVVPALERWSLTGWAVSSVGGDLNGDGFDDFALSRLAEGNGDSFGRVEALSGKDASPLWRRDNPIPHGALMGSSLQFAGDVTGDGRPDLLTYAFTWDGFYAEAFALDARSGAVIAAIPLPGFPQTLTFYPVAVGDCTGDGVSDLLVLRNPKVSSVRTELLRGGDFAPLARLQGSRDRRVGDVDGDGFADYAIGRSLGNHASEISLYSGRCDGVDVYGSGCSGGSGESPRLLVWGPCDLKANAALSLVVQGVPASAPGLLVFGQAPANVPMGGCVLHVAPLVGPVIGFVTDAFGEAWLGGTIPPGLSGAQVHMQVFVATKGDTGPAPGLVGTNGLTLAFP